MATKNPTLVNKLLSLRLKIEHLQSKVRFLVLSCLAINMLLGTAFQNRYIEKVSQKEEMIGSVNSNSVVIADTAEESPMAVEKSEHKQIVKAPCAIA